MRGWSISLPAECGPMGGVVRRLGHGLSHQRRRADHAVESGAGDHLDDGGNAPTLLTDQPAPGPVQLDLGRGVRTVPQLVLEPLEVDGVPLTIRGPAGDEETGQPTRSLGQHEEGVAHRGRAEPLVPGEEVLGPRATAVDRDRTGQVGPHVGAALLLGHRHPHQHTGLLRSGLAGAVVGTAHQQRLPLGGDLWLDPQRRNRRCRHRDRAPVTRLDLGAHVGERGPGHLGGLVGPPREESAAHGSPPGRAGCATRGGTPPRPPGARRRRGSVGGEGIGWRRIPIGRPRATPPASRSRTDRSRTSLRRTHRPRHRGADRW